jgi:hypothetical protein
LLSTSECNVGLPPARPRIAKQILDLCVIAYSDALGVAWPNDHREAF